MKPFVFFIKLLLVIFMLMFIWGNSFLSGEMSQRESDLVLEVVEPVVEPVQEQLYEMGYDISKELIVRKMAHFTEYFILGILMYLLFVRPDGRSRYFLPVLLCAAAAGVDEGIQIFAVDRGPMLRDVALDFFGSCVGILGAALIVLFIYLGSERRRSERY